MDQISPNKTLYDQHESVKQGTKAQPTKSSDLSRWNNST